MDPEVQPRATCLLPNTLAQLFFEPSAEEHESSCSGLRTDQRLRAAYKSPWGAPACWLSSCNNLSTSPFTCILESGKSHTSLPVMAVNIPPSPSGDSKNPNSVSQKYGRCLIQSEFSKQVQSKNNNEKQPFQHQSISLSKCFYQI